MLQTPGSPPVAVGIATRSVPHGCVQPQVSYATYTLRVPHSFRHWPALPLRACNGLLALPPRTSPWAAARVSSIAPGNCRLVPGMPPSCCKRLLVQPTHFATAGCRRCPMHFAMGGRLSLQHGSRHLTCPAHKCLPHGCWRCSPRGACVHYAMGGCWRVRRGSRHLPALPWHNFVTPQLTVGTAPHTTPWTTAGCRRCPMHYAMGGCCRVQRGSPDSSDGLSTSNGSSTSSAVA